MIGAPHDAFFKAVFGEPANAIAHFVVTLPPRVLRYVDLATARLQPGSHDDEDLRQSHSDLLHQVEMQGKPALLHLLFEHRGSSDPLVPFRLLAYTMRLWERWLAEFPGGQDLPPVIASVDARSGSLLDHQDLLVYSAILGSGQHIVHELLAGRRARLHVVQGKASLGDAVLMIGDGAGMATERAVSFRAWEQSAILLPDLGGCLTFDQGIHA